MEYIVICLASLGVSGLTLYSGFGLGTLLLPVLALFFPVETAVAATAIVHGANNLLKITVVGNTADRSLVLRFGLPAIAAALVGAATLAYVAHFPALATYQFGGRTAIVTPVKLAMAILMLFFALAELLPSWRTKRFDRRYLTIGGLLSGFFGGFSGHQGALRSAFLVKTGISTEAFVGTNAVIGFLVDLTRITTYATIFAAAGLTGDAAGHWPLIVTATLAAFAGVLIGRRYLHKVTMDSVQRLTGLLLLAIAFFLALGLI